MRTTTWLWAFVCAAVLVGCSSLAPIAEEEDRRVADSSVLRESLARGSAVTRARAALAMGRVQSAAYAAPLAAAVGDPDRDVRLAALFALGQLGLAEGAEVPEAAWQACVGSLGDPDPEIAAVALEAVGKLAGPRVPETVVPLFGHNSPRVRVEAALALLRFQFVPLWRRVREEPPELPPAAVAALIEALEDDVADVRWSAAYAFSRYGNAEAVPALLARIGDTDEWTRLFSVRAVGRSGVPASAAGLLPALDDPSFRVRAETIQALGRLEAVEPLPESLVEDSSFHVRAALANALGAAGDADSLGVLRRLESDESPTVRAQAIGALAQRLRDAFGPALSAYLGDERAEIRAAAAAAAGEIDAGRLDLLRTALADSDARVRTAGLESLGDLVEAPELLDHALASEDLAVRGTAVALVAERDDADRLERLTRAYDGSRGLEWIEVREAIVDALADIPGAEGLLARALAADPAPSVRVRAHRVLRSLGMDAAEVVRPPPDPSPFLAERFERDPVVVLETTRGEIAIQGLSHQAPIHVASFSRRVAEGFYDGLGWHRVVSNFVVQGGDPRGDGWGSGGYTLRDEIHRTRYLRGTVGMPKAGKDTGGCQIFITHVPTPHLDGNYTVFGTVISGMDVVDRLEVGDRILRARVR